LELDELSSSPLDHRLFVLTGLQTKATPTEARIQYLRVDTPSAPTELPETFVSPPPGSQFKYDISAIEVIPEHKLLLAIGNAVDPQNPLNNKLLLVLYRYGPIAGGGEGLVQLQALERDPLPLRSAAGIDGRVLVRLIDGEAYEIGGDLIAFVRGPMAQPATKGPWGIAAVKIDPNPPGGGSHLDWYEFSTAALTNLSLPSVVFDPFWDLKAGPQSMGQTANPPAGDLAVTSMDLVQQQTGTETISLLYLSCKDFNQILEFDVSDFEATGFVPQKKLDLTVAAPNAFSDTDPATDALFYLSAHHDPNNSGGPIDLLYVIGQQFMHVCERVPDPISGPVSMSGLVPVYKPLKAETKQVFNTDAGAVGQRMLEYSPLGQTGQVSDFGGREDYWTLCTDVDFPWTIFDMTNRVQKPTAESPGVVSRRYSPGGADGAVYIPEWESAYVTNFGGVVRYDLKVDPFALDPEGNPAPLYFCQPDYDSYGPATIFLPQNGAVPGFPVDFATEQLDLVDISATDKRLVAVTGRGRAYEWKLNSDSNPLNDHRYDPISVFSNPPGGRVIPPIQGGDGSEKDAIVLQRIWGLDGSEQTKYSNSYSHFIAAGKGVHTGRPYVLIDLALTGKVVDEVKFSDRILLGRYWFEFEVLTPEGLVVLPDRFYIIDLSGADIPGANAVTPESYWIDISESGGFAAVGCGNGLYIVSLTGDGAALPGGEPPPADPLFALDVDWAVRDVFHVGDWSGGSSPFPSNPHGGFDKVEALAWVGDDFLAMSLSSTESYTCDDALGVSVKKEPLAGGIAIFKFGHHTGQLEGQVYFAEDYQGYLPPGGANCAALKPPVDQILDIDYFIGGAIHAIEVSEGVHRIYAGSSSSGAVVELELVHGAVPTVQRLDTWSDPTHTNQVSVCRPYLIGLPSGLPIVLLGRYTQTIAVLASKGALDIPGE
jgi:hypothetical protein